MKYFLGIVPPMITKERVLNFQKSFPSNQIPYLYEPHITLKVVPLGMFDDKSLLTKVVTLVGNHKRFNIKLNGVDSFENEVIFLDPGLPKGLIDLHMKLCEVFGSTEEMHKKFFEGPLYHPHMTLGTTWGGLNKAELALMKERAESEFYTAIPPFQVDFIRIFEREEDGAPYHKFLDIPLKP